MNTMEMITNFFGWCTVLNMGMYLLTIVALITMRGFVVRTNAKIFGIKEDEVARMTFSYVGNYKLAIIVLCFIPYVALKMMA